MRPFINSTVLFVLLSACLAGCSGEQGSPRVAGKTAAYIVAVNNPLAYFAQRLIGSEVEVRLLAPPEIDPATWQPTAADVLQLQGAELVLLNGAGYSGWLDKVSVTSSKLLVTSEAAKEQWIALEAQVTHSHGPQGEHAHGDYAFTTWMDIALAMTQARSIAEALQQHWPEYSEEIANNMQALAADLDALDAGYMDWARQVKGRQLVYSHPVYQYFQRRYNTRGHSLHWEPDSMPSQAQWDELRELRKTGILLVWESPPNEDIINRMKDLDIPHVVISPGANRGEEDWLAIQAGNLRQLPPPLPEE